MAVNELPEVTQLEINGTLYQLADAKARAALETAVQSISTIPSQSGTCVYSGGSYLSPTWLNYNTDQLEIGGVTSANTVGTFDATFTPKSGYKWFDGTTEAKTVQWVVTKATLAIPTVSGNPTYTGNPVSPTISGFDSGKMSKSGDSATAVGNHTVTFSLLDTTNYQWSDGSTNDKSVQWSVVRATASLSLDPTSLSLDVSSLTGTITAVTDADGVVSAVSSDTSKVTIESVNGKVITIKGIARTTSPVTISVTVAQGTNYNAITTAVTCAVSVSIPSNNIEENSWSDIGAIGAAGNGASYFSVGDTIPVLINGTVGDRTINKTLYAFVIGFNHNGTNGIYFQGFKSAKTNGADVALCDFTGASYFNKTDGTKCFNMNHWGNYNYGGWKACDMRYDILGSTKTAPSGYGSAKTSSSVGYDAPTDTATSPVANTLMAALPAELRAVMKPWTVYSDNKGGGSDTASNVSTSVDYLPLLSEFEIHGSRTYANSSEKNNQAQFAYYANGNSKIKKNDQDNTTAVNVWCRSVYSSSTNGFCSVDNSGSPNYNGARFAYGVSPAFRVA